MRMQSKRLIEKLEDWHRLNMQSWDNPGLLVGSAKREVHKVYSTGCGWGGC